MPYGDRRGPDGRGPMTGRRAGFCAGNDRPGYATLTGGIGRWFGNTLGYGRGRGNGRGRGYGRGFYQDVPPEVVERPQYYRENFVPRPVYTEPSPADEKKYLESVVEDITKELESIKARLTELDKKEE